MNTRTTPDSPVTVDEVARRDKTVLRHLIELYMYDFSEFTGGEVDQHGLFGYSYLDHYWTDDDRHPFFIHLGATLVGFALVRSGNPNEIAEFFVMRGHRRRGIGRRAALQLFSRFLGRWRIEQTSDNHAATEFWRSIIPYPFSESPTDRGGIAQTFEST